MNVSMQDAYNLGWKLASVIKGVAHPNILRTYHEERLPVARRLIEFDKRICRGMLEGEYTFDDDHRQALVEENTSMSGLGIAYPPNIVMSKPIMQQQNGVKKHPAVNGHTPKQPDPVKAIKLGARITSELVLSQSDSQPYQLQRIFQSTGEWNLVVFGGDILVEDQKRRVGNLAAALSSPKSIVQKLRSRSRAKNDPVGSVSVYLVHSAARTEVDIWELPELFRPPDEDTGIDYGKVFVDNESYHVGGGKAYEELGIPSRGCILLLRPDQHISFIGDLEDSDHLEHFLESVNAGTMN